MRSVELFVARPMLGMIEMVVEQQTVEFLVPISFEWSHGEELGDLRDFLAAGFHSPMNFDLILSRCCLWPLFSTLFR